MARAYRPCAGNSQALNTLHLRLPMKRKAEQPDSGAQPATLSQQVEQQVEQLGHYPKRFKKPATDKERAENSLAEKISKQWSKLRDATKAKLNRLQQETQKHGRHAHIFQEVGDTAPSGGTFGSAGQPASKTRTLDTDPSVGASGSAAQPATLSEQVEQQVERLGHYPKRFKKPTTDKERAENALADKIPKHWSKLSEATKAKLTRLQQETKGKDVEAQEQQVEQQVEQLGHYPKRFMTPATDKECAENSLARQISMQWSKLSDATKAKLTRLQQETERPTQDILEEQVEQQVEQLGHYPKRFMTPATDEERAENSLAKKITMQWSKLSDATKAKLTRLQQETIPTKISEAIPS